MVKVLLYLVIAVAAGFSVLLYVSPSARTYFAEAAVAVIMAH